MKHLKHATRCVRGLLVASVCAFAVRDARAQAPNETWRTISTQHFRVTFPASLESLARRAGGEAERAWTRIASELHPPRGPVDLVIADNQDASNGQATYFPTNRIVIWAHPPIDDAALRFSDDWLEEVVTHELTHIFQLDRTRGWWRAAQMVFGRHPSLFPNARSPRWLSEGLAVAFESQYGNGGRLNGSELRATLDASSASGRPLTPGRLSLSTPYWPTGDLAYFAGARVVSNAARAGGDSSIRRFVERVAWFPIPYLWDIQAKAAFGASFGSLARSNIEHESVAIDQSVVVPSQSFWQAAAPRWRGDTVYFTASTGRDLTGLYAATENHVARIARRNSTGPFSFVGTKQVYAQLDYTDPYRLYSAIYVDGDRVRGSERLAAPDARADGTIVSVSADRGGAQLVLITMDGRRGNALGTHDQDVQWSAPRWSHRGDRIAAVRWRRGGETEIVVLDASGAVISVFATARAVQSHPSWSPDDNSIYFTSDRRGRSAVYRVRADGSSAAPVELIARDTFGLYEPEVSPDGARIAAFRMTPEGARLVIVPATAAAETRGPAFAFSPAARDTIVTITGPAHGYSPARTLIPRYWFPTLGTSSRGNHLPGFHTSGIDVVGRYSLAVNGSWDVQSGEFYGDAGLTYRGFGRPVVAAEFSQAWSAFDITTSAGDTVGSIARRSRTGALTFSWSRPRVRTGVSIVGGAELELRELFVHPESLLTHFDPPLTTTARFPSLVFGAAWSTVTESPLGIAPEDGISLATTVRRRWRASDPAGTAANSIVGTVRAFKSFPLGGHARHSIALRGSGGDAGRNMTSAFTAGGVSGASLELVPGYSIGDTQRLFFVRGFAPGVLHGSRAWGATAEYRAPLVRIARGIWPFPIYWQRAAVAFFGDGASAWCPKRVAATAVCPAGGTPERRIMSVGAELLLDTTLDYDSPTRFRLGIAAPVSGGDATRAKSATVYFSLGLPF